MKRQWMIPVALLGLVLAAGVYISIPGHAPAGQPALVELSPRALADFQSDFNRASSGPRVILLISPT